MPSEINVNGTVTAVPGVRTIPRLQSVAGRSVGAKVLAIVADMPFLERARPLRVTSPQALLRVEPTSSFLAKVARVVYSPAADARVLGGPAAVVLVSPTPSTQAARTFNDADGQAALVVRSKVWGPIGNRTRVSLSANAVDATAFDILVERDGISESFEGVQSGNVLGFHYDGSQATAVSLTYTRASGFVITQTMAGIALGTLAPTDLVFAGALTFTPSSAAAGGETYTVTVEGLDEDGVEQTETLTWESTDGTNAQVTTTVWSDVTSVEFATDGVSTPTFTMAGTAFAIPVDEDRTAYDIAEQVNAFASRGYTCTVESPDANTILSTELDNASGLDILGGVKYLQADLWAIVQALASSNLVEAEVAAGGRKPPVVTGGVVSLAGGSKTIPATADWTAAFSALRSVDVNIIWPYSTTAAVHLEGVAHCDLMAGSGARAGVGERCIWVGAAANETLAQIKTRTKALNSRHAAMTVQEVKFRAPNGVESWHGPEWFALICAAMQAGVLVGVPLTTKRPNIVDARNNTGWSVVDDIEEVLRSGVVIAADNGDGLRIVRSITTYLPKKPEAYTEVSANESFNASNRGVRDAVQDIIGDPGAPSTPARIAVRARNELVDQINDQVIKAASLEALNVEDLGDLYRINYEVAVIEPANFITTHPTVTRNPAA